MLYAVDLPNDERSTDLVRRFLLSLAKRFNTDKVKVDTSVYNPSRISKLYGTLTMKGENTADRPHRYSKVLTYPMEYKVVPLQLVEQVAGEYKAGTKSAENSKADKRSEDHRNAGCDAVSEYAPMAEDFVKDFLDKHEIEYTQKTDGRYLARFLLASCPFCGETDKSAVVVVHKSGKIGYKCQHNRCNGEHKKSWRDFRQHYEPDWQPKDDEHDEDKLLEAIRAACDLWHSPDWKSYATMETGQHLPVEGSSFARWATSLALDTTGRGLSKNKLDTLVSTCSAIAVHKGEKHEVYRRVARLDDVIEIDLGDDTFEAVIVTSSGWTIGRPSARFVRSDNAAPLPRPVKGGSIDLLRPLVNLTDEQFPLFIGSILDAYKGTKDYLVSALIGEEGTGKSAMLRIKKRLIDPAVNAELPAPPKNEEDLAIECNSCHFVVYDNVGKIPDWLSDAYCRVATGSGVKTRKFYQQQEQTIYKLLNPLAMNGIEDFMVKGDLVRRAVIMQTEPIAGHAKQADFWGDFNKVCPAVLGVLYDALALGLKTHRDYKVEAGGMTDSANWIAACVPAFGWSFEDWHRPYLASREMAQAGLLENSKPCSYLLDWFKGKQSWVGTATELYDTLKAVVPYGEERYFPANGQSLSSHFRRLAPALRTTGVDFKSGVQKKVANKNQRLVTIRRIDHAQVTQEVTQVTQGNATKNGHCGTVDPVKIGQNEKVTQVTQFFLPSSFQEKERACGDGVDTGTEKRESMSKIALPALPDAKTPKNTGSTVPQQGESDCVTCVTCVTSCVTLPQPRKPTRQRLGNGVIVESIPSRLGSWQVGKETKDGRIDWLTDTGDYRWAKTRGERLAKTGK